MSSWATELFGVSPQVSYTLRHFSGFHQWIRCLTRFLGFSLEGDIYPLLATPDTFHFPFSFNTVELNWTSSYSQAHTIQHQTQCQISTMYTLSGNVVLPHTNAMQFVPLHSNPWPMYEDFYMDILHRTLCVCYEHSCLMHTTFHIFNIYAVMLIFHIFKSHHISMHYIFSII